MLIVTDSIPGYHLSTCHVHSTVVVGGQVWSDSFLSLYAILALLHDHQALPTLDLPAYFLSTPLFMLKPPLSLQVSACGGR